MTDAPTTPQLLLLGMGTAVYLVGGIFSARRARLERTEAPEPAINLARLLVKICLYIGTCITVGVLVWHCITIGRPPVDDNFGTFLCLAILLSLFVAYTQRVHPLRGLDFFIMPVVLLMLLLAAVFGKTMPHEYRETTWSTVHRVTAYGGFVAFAVAGAVGGMFLLVNRRLRQKRLAPGQQFGSLERLEHLNIVWATLGFPLLTIGLLTGFFRIFHDGVSELGPQWYRNPKVVLTCAAWVVYALVLHSPINPSFRGRRTAILSVVGLVLMIGIFVAVQFVK